MSALTKSWLQKQITELESTRDEIPFGLDEDGNNTLAALKMALAGMEAEPAYFINRVKRSDAYGDDIELRTYCYELDALKSKDDFGGEVVPLYAAPQPATVVPDAIPKLKDDQRFKYVKDGIRYSVSYANGWNACRAAMLQGADGKPELTVSYGPMPESNGKTNWTAILHRKGEGMLDGITIDRSEYPGRVLYAADRARYLIGEKPDRPFILEYDADKHSGYVAPGKAGGNSPVIQDGWVMVPEEPTHEMLEAGDEQFGTYDVYRRMIAAAPQQEVK